MNTVVSTTKQTMPTSPIRLPKTTNYCYNEIQPHDHTIHEIYKVQPTSNVFDPSIINTPPNEFMKQLKQRINVYYDPK